MNYPSSPRRLQRSRNDRMIGGVCGGLAEYLNMDPTLVRVLAVIIALVTAAFPVIAIYLILMLVLPEAQQHRPAPPLSYPQPPQQPTWSRSTEDPVWGASGAPWQQKQPAEPTPSPKQTAEELFSRAKNITKPSQPNNTQPGTGEQKPGSES
jgi:phage shock protein C